jgi:ATP-binding cassette subfamily C protein
VLGVGAYLVIQGAATAGAIVAASILSGRALAPIDLAIAHWKGFVAARQSWRRLEEVLSAAPGTRRALALPAPREKLSVQSAKVAAPGGERAILQGISFSIEAGHGLGIIGPSGSGKSTLARALVGAWRPAAGRIRLDGADLDQWLPEELGKHIGYLPQDVELFGGSIVENIARFDERADANAIIAAARAAGVHDLIVGLQHGYGAQIGEQGEVLSAGQRQRIGLARALYGDPFLVVLDEPNSNLDSDGEAALGRAIAGVRARGGIVVIVAHRASALAEVDYLLALDHGRVHTFGRKEEVYAQLFPDLQNRMAKPAERPTIRGSHNVATLVPV